VNDTVAYEKDGTEALSDQAGIGRLLVRGGGEHFEVDWDAGAKVTPMGSVVFFAQYLKTGGLLDRLCEGAPLAYGSNNAPKARDVLGTAVLSILSGQTRYAHIGALRDDRVSAEALGMSKVVSEDSVRRALNRGTAEAWDAWLAGQERAVWEPLLAEPYILDIDSTVKPLYGHQEGAEPGYNPKKPGRPSHNYHTYFIGALRLVLGVEVRPGKEHSGGCGMPGLWALIDSLPPGLRPRLIRGDVSYGSEQSMAQAERRAQPYLFKLRRSAKVKARFRELTAPGGGWNDAGDGWQAAECRLSLGGWTSERRCVFLRRPAARPAACAAPPRPAEPEFDFAAGLGNAPVWEYVVLVTNDETLSAVALSQAYRDRADCENVFDEIKNQWGWAGFVTRDLRRCRIIARLIALVYNWWNVFTRLAQPDSHMEAVTSRPLLLHAVGRLVSTGRRKIIRLTSTHALSAQIRLTLDRIGAFMNRLAATAEQLSAEQVWALILSAAFVKWLQGKVLHPVSDGAQTLLRLTT
jgi:hypothetical protein